MKDLRRFEIWIADMNPGKGIEPGKIRPVVLVQSNFLHDINYLSTIACPISSLQEGVSKIRIPVNPSPINGLKKKSSIIVDQMTAVYLNRLREKIGYLEEEYRTSLCESIIEILDLENIY